MLTAQANKFQLKNDLLSVLSQFLNFKPNKEIKRLSAATCPETFKIIFTAN